MVLIPIQQALFHRKGDTFQLVARSPGFLEAWLPEAQRLGAGFGIRPAGVACPACLFAQPLAKRSVAIVQVADQGLDAADQPDLLGFYFLVLTQRDYNLLGGDPFLLAEHSAPPWQARAELPALSWPLDPDRPRTIAQVQDILRGSDSALLLGGVQVLVDGGRLVLERPVPDTDLLRNLWLLLPTSTRFSLWPATFAFGNALGFHALIVPRVPEEETRHYVTEEQARDYPEGRYELDLQFAAEAGDQRELDVLFARRSRAETWRLGLILLVLSLLLMLIMNWINAG